MHVFLSPHLDDAVFSCGGLIAHLTHEQQTVTVVTVMAGDPPRPLPDTPIVRTLHQRWDAGYDPVAARREEDQRAVNLLGAKARHLLVPDCVYRTGRDGALYPSEESLFGDLHPADGALIDSLPALDEGVTHLYAPLGVGQHVDHQVVRDWGLALAGRRPALTLAFYEEYPYATGEAAVARALAAISGIRVETRLFHLTEDELQARLRAMNCYQSQISTFWENVAAMKEATRRFVLRAGDGVAVERYWHPAKR